MAHTLADVTAARGEPGRAVTDAFLRHALEDVRPPAAG